MSANLYPLRFEPIFQRYLWGGQRLSSLLGKGCGPGNTAESWEIVDYGDHQSEVKFGALRGHTLRQLMQEYGSELVGKANWKAIHQPTVPDSLRGRFPLLFKFLDANQALSIQVHPDDRYGMQMKPPDLGKSEAWFVMHADPGSRIYCGLKAGVSPADFAAALRTKSTVSLMNAFEPQVGDFVFIPAGTIHALGAGLVIAEIQQSSNTTFRVFDWDRVDDKGVARALHIEQAMSVTRFDFGPVKPIRTESKERSVGAARLIEADKFTVDRYRTDSSSETPIPLRSADSFRILVVTRGKLWVENDPAGQALTIGDTILVPAGIAQAKVFGDRETEFLDITA
jgi:mannose-6-phosphate isomerase